MMLVYSDLPGLHASDSLQATFPPSLLTVPYYPDIVLYNERNNLVALLELRFQSLPGTNKGRETTKNYCQN